MQINTKPYRVKMYVDEERHAVACVVESAFGTFKGVAKCSPKDTFDIKVGKKIAYNRALRQANSRAIVVIRDELIKPFNAKITELKQRMDKSAKIIQEEMQKLN